MANPYTIPPHGIMEDLGACLGFESANRLIALYGGTSIYVSGDPKQCHKFSLILGPEALARFCEEFGGQTLDLPENEEFSRLRRIRAVSHFMSKGYRVSEVAKILGQSARQVSNYRAQAEELLLIPMVIRAKAPRGDKAPAQIPLTMGWPPEIPPQDEAAQGG